MRHPNVMYIAKSLTVESEGMEELLILFGSKFIRSLIQISLLSLKFNMQRQYRILFVLLQKKLFLKLKR